MTVDELRNLLSSSEGKTQIVVSCDDSKEVKYFEVGEVSLQKGSPMRDEDGQPHFEAKSTGSVTWLVINVTEDA